MSRIRSLAPNVDMKMQAVLNSAPIVVLQCQHQIVAIKAVMVITAVHLVNILLANGEHWYLLIVPMAVLMSAFALSVHIKKLKPLKNREQKQGSVKINIDSKATKIESELHLLGLRVDEALNHLDSYINSALLANMNTIRIVHGKGTGALKKAVHEYLKNNPHIKSYRLGNFGEGDLGVTIAELK